MKGGDESREGRHAGAGILSPKDVRTFQKRERIRVIQPGPFISILQTTRKDSRGSGGRRTTQVEACDSQGFKPVPSSLREAGN